MRLAVQVVILVALLQRAGASRLADYRVMSKNVSRTLDTLLAKERYDKRLRPELGGPPTLVTVSIYVKSMSSVSETEQKYSMDTYFRQSWFDPRLRFSLPGIEEFSMSWLFLDRVWKPDTYIVNGHRSHLHRITVPNKFARVRSDGFITYSMRLTVQASCPMHLRKFPLDSQRCPLLISSYGYTSADIVYDWHPTKVGLESGVELAQYDLVNVTSEREQRIRRGSGEYSMISAVFYLRRNTGYYTLQVFVPCGLIVCSSWVSFWIDPDAVPARVSLGVTTVLSMTTMGFGARAALPRVNYATAFDWFIILCFAFVFAVMVEYAAINFIDKVTVDLRRVLEERKKKRSSTTSGSFRRGVSGSATAPCTAPGTPATPGRSRSSSAGVAAEAVNAEAVVAEDGVAPPSPPASGPRAAPATPSVVVAADALVEPRGPHQTHSAADEIEYADQDEEPAAPGPRSLGTQTNPADYSVAVEPDEDDGEDDLAPRVAGPALFAGGLLALPDGGLGRTQSLRRCLSAPYRIWEQTRFLPSEEEVQKQMLSNEEPDKFTNIDIVSRKVFPIAFGSLLALYWILYAYFITDMFPGDEDKNVLYELARPHRKMPHVVPREPDKN